MKTNEQTIGEFTSYCSQIQRVAVPRLFDLTVSYHLGSVSGQFYIYGVAETNVSLIQLSILDYAVSLGINIVFQVSGTTNRYS